MSENHTPKAKEVYDTLCAALENRGWHFKKEEDELLVVFGVEGDDIPMNFGISVDETRQLVSLLSPMPFKMKEDKRIEGAIATCAVTSRLANGCFSYNIQDGTIAFRVAASYRESRIGEGLISYMIDLATAVIDDYNDKFFALNVGLLDLSEFLDNN